MIRSIGVPHFFLSLVDYIRVAEIGWHVHFLFWLGGGPRGGIDQAGNKLLF